MQTVSTLADSGAGSLRAAIAAAALGEEIQFSVAGTINLTSGALTISQDVIITGPGFGSLTVSTALSQQVFIITGGVVTITGMTISGGTSLQGGNINNAGTLTISNLVIAGGLAIGGGGIYNTGTITADNCQIQNNGNSGADPNSHGGGIWNSGTLTMNFCSVSNNFILGTNDVGGGGIWNDGTITATNCTINSNSLTVDSSPLGGFGAAISNEGGTVTLTNCAVESNTLSGGVSDSGYGGAISSQFGGTLTVEHSTIGNNGINVGVSAFGAGIFNAQGNSLYVYSSTISGNIGTGSTVRGGAIYCDPTSPAQVSWSTVVENSTGLFLDSSGIAHSYNTILAGNVSNDLEGGGLGSGLLSDGHNLFGSTTTPVTPGSGDQFGLTLVALKIGALLLNGGPTKTHALLQGSPAIDSGDNTNAPSTDQRGNPRIVNSIIDIGSYEAALPVVPPIIPPVVPPVIPPVVVPINQPGCKPCQLVECVPANDYTYSLALPPPPANPLPPFGNDELTYCCPSGTITVTGSIPAWISINTVTNCVSIVPNTFRGSDKTVLNGLAQNALNQFVANQVTCTVAPSEFHNALATFYKTCTGGIYEGPAICETVNAGVFTSLVSQIDADTQARYAAYVAMIDSPPGPCCQGNAYLGGGGWQNYSLPPQNTTVDGRTANWTWNDTGAVLTFDLDMVPDAGRPDTNAAVGITMLWNHCNSWPVYDFHIHVDYTWDTRGINGVGEGVGLGAVYALGSLLATPVLNQPIGTFGSASYDVTFPTLSGADSIQIEIGLGNSTTDHTASGFFRGTMTITPLIPPTYIAPTCSVMTAIPVPFNYALRPANDDFDNAILVAGAVGNLTFDNTYASIEPNEPLTIAGWESDRTGWYMWVAPFSGTVTFDPAGSTLANDPAIAVYTGTALLNLVSVVEKNQTAPPFTWTATAGTLYYWRIGGFFGDTGVTHLAWTLV